MAISKGKAISHFLERVDRFPQVVLVSDEEVKELFGDEVVAALGELEGYGLEENMCAGCGGICCRDIGCELYASQFSQCPIHDFRPIVCRFHFCRRFDDTGKSLVIDLRDIFLGCFRAVDLWDSANLRSMDIPPLVEVCPELVNAVDHLVAAVRENRLNPQMVEQRICLEAQKYRKTSSK